MRGPHTGHPGSSAATVIVRTTATPMRLVLRRAIVAGQAAIAASAAAA